MGCKVLCPSVALLAYLMICQHVRAQCTHPSFGSKNAKTVEPPTRYPDGSSVTFECLIGHRPIDPQASRSVTCRGTLWTHLELSCTRKPCGSLPDIVNGRYVMTGNLFGDTAKPVCDRGYVLDGPETTKTCRDGGWDGRDALCKENPQREIGNKDAEVQPSTTHTPSQALILAVKDVAAGLREINESMNKLITLLGSQRSA